MIQHQPMMNGPTALHLRFTTNTVGGWCRLCSVYRITFSGYSWISGKHKQLRRYNSAYIYTTDQLTEPTQLKDMDMLSYA